MDAKQVLMNHEIKLAQSELESKQDTAKNTIYKALEASLKYSLKVASLRYSLKEDEYKIEREAILELSDGAIMEIADRLLQELTTGTRIATIKAYKDQKGKTLDRVKMLENIGKYYK